MVLRLETLEPKRTPELIEGRIELTFLAVSRYGVRSRENADLINKHPSSMTRWSNTWSPVNEKTPISANA